MRIGGVPRHEDGAGDLVQKRSRRLREPARLVSAVGDVGGADEDGRLKGLLRQSRRSAWRWRRTYRFTAAAGERGEEGKEGSWRPPVREGMTHVVQIIA
jgi:hypothetical protein